jgi:hypothetical protein
MRFRIIYLALALALVALPVALGGAVSVVQSAGGYDYTALDQLYRSVDLELGIDDVEAETEFSGRYEWHLFIQNGSNETVYEPTISVDSSLDPSFFPNVDEFPAIWSLPSIGPLDQWTLMDLNSSYPVTFTLGYDCSRTVEPLEVPPGGGIQTIAIKVEPIDSRYTNPSIWLEVIGSVIEGSNTQPEGATAIVEAERINWWFDAQLEEYIFGVQLQVANPSNTSLVHKPQVKVWVEYRNFLDGASGTSTTIHDEILSGDITYSVTVSGNWRHNMTHSWQVTFAEMAEYNVAEYDLTIASSEGGSVIAPDEGNFAYEEGTVVDLKAEPDEGYQFVEWSGDVDTIADAQAASTTITVNDDYSITATFEEIPPVPTGCFVATAAYGTPMAKEIQTLREFRDEYLLGDPLGQGLIDIYYRISPPIGDFITDHPSLKSLVRAQLMPIVAMCSIILDIVPQFAGSE